MLWDQWEYSRQWKCLNAVFERHQQRIHVLKALEFGLVDFLDDAFVVGREMHGLVGELGREVGEILSENSRKMLLRFQISFTSFLT